MNGEDLSAKVLSLEKQLEEKNGNIATMKSKTKDFFGKLTAGRCCLFFK